jgi:polysaccharide deacetylase family protein (PEP-CTERM system associated)
MPGRRQSGSCKQARPPDGREWIPAGMTVRQATALPYDIEDWHQLVEWKLNGTLPASSGHVVAQTHDILDVLAERGVRATFFILGLVATAHPELVRAIAAGGHEVGSHGWGHQLVYRQTRDAFAAETRRSKAVLEDVLGTPILGYRAAEFSITEHSRWALDVLAELGFTYDSSIFPIHGRRYGIPGTPLAPYTVRTTAGDLRDVPLTAVEKGGRRWQIGGGGYFRLFPYAVTRRAIEEVNAAGRPAVAYFHPYEFSRPWLVPRLTSRANYLLGARYVVLHNVNRRRNRRRFLHLLADFRFVPIADLINHG